MVITFFTKYTSKGPSSRYRSFYYFEKLKEENQLKVYPLFDDQLSEAGGVNVSLRVLICFIKRLYFVLRSCINSDIVVIEYELFPYTPLIVERLFVFCGVKFILDYDDAIFHNYDQHKNNFVRFLIKNKIRKLAEISSGIVTGSSYLTNYFNNYNNNVIEIPTSIKLSDYTQSLDDGFCNVNEKVYIGWIGSKTTSRNLFFLSEVFKKISIEFPKVSFIFCGYDDNEREKFQGIPIEFMNWSSENELKFLNRISLGIMPLEDNYFNKGKCGFKLIQYMAFAKPTLSTPFQTNLDIDNRCGNLFASTEDEWYEQIKFFLNNITIYNEVGISNLRRIEKFYSIEANFKRLHDFYKLTSIGGSVNK